MNNIKGMTGPETFKTECHHSTQNCQGTRDQTPTRPASSFLMKNEWNVENMPLFVAIQGWPLLWLMATGEIYQCDIYVNNVSFIMPKKSFL